MPGKQSCCMFDEFGPMELRPTAGVCWARKGHTQRLRATYSRKSGTEQFLAFYDVHDDVLTGTIHKRKTSKDLLQAWERLRYCFPRNERIYLIMDNLSSHWKDSLVHYARHNRITLVATPTYSSWLNAIEAHFTPLKKFCITNSDDKNHLERRKRIYRYLNIRNKEAASQSCPLNVFRKY
ncbi:MAG: transposase [Bacteroidota bacterium]